MRDQIDAAHDGGTSANWSGSAYAEPTADAVAKGPDGSATEEGDEGEPRPVPLPSGILSFLRGLVSPAPPPDGSKGEVDTRKVAALREQWRRLSSESVADAGGAVMSPAHSPLPATFGKSKAKLPSPSPAKTWIKPETDAPPMYAPEHRRRGRDEIRDEIAPRSIGEIDRRD